MKKKKVAMALVLSAVSAVVAAPALLNEETENLAGAENAGAEEATPVAKAIIDIKKNNQLDMPEEEKVALVDEVNELLKRNVSTEDLRDGLSVVLSGYGEGDMSLEQEVYQELSLAYTEDSTNLSAHSAAPVVTAPPKVVVFCHAACHYACHGSRGWR